MSNVYTLLHKEKTHPYTEQEFRIVECKFRNQGYRIFRIFCSKIAVSKDPLSPLEEMVK